MDIIRDEKWVERLESIAYSLFALRASQYLFRELEKIINANPALMNDRYLVGWIRQNYFVASAMGVRRQVDEHPDCISLIKLLARIRENPTLLSRERYHCLSPTEVMGGDPHLSNEWDFDELVGKGREYIDPLDVDKDIETLKTASKSIREHADKVIAHFDKKSLSYEYPLDLNELDEVIETFEKILNKYHSLITGAGIIFDPVPPVSWKSVLLIPWLPQSE